MPLICVVRLPENESGDILIPSQCWENRLVSKESTCKESWVELMHNNYA